MIKPQNYYAIYDFAMGTNRPEMQGTKLNALYNLIQKKGEPIRSNDEKLSGVKALRISDREHVAIIRTSFNNKSFYPCQLKTILLTELKAA